MEHRKREAVAPRRVRVHAGVWLAGLATALVLVVLWAATVGTAAIGPLEVARIAAGAALPWVPAGGSGIHRTIVLQFRLPRVALAVCVGTALAAAGAVMQGFFRNPMADPSIIGVSSGAATGAVAVIVTGVSVPYGVPAAAFAGALVAAFTVFLVATRDGRTPVATLLLSGVAVQTFLGAAVSFMLVGADDQSLRQAVYWLMGSLAGSDWSEVGLVLPVTLAGFVLLLVHARDLNVLLLGETDAATLGVAVPATRRRLLAVSAVVTGAAVAFVGVVGFVGLVVPHVVRLLVGPDHRVLLPASALAGGAFLVAADTVARSAAQGLPVGVVTAFVGAPFFLYLLRRREVHEL
ncbi:MAG: iron chelate uptake ABC transporter family permease subunit [Halobacteriaceae archaeon]